MALRQTFSIFAGHVRQVGRISRTMYFSMMFVLELFEPKHMAAHGDTLNTSGKLPMLRIQCKCVCRLTLVYSLLTCMVFCNQWANMLKSAEGFQNQFCIFKGSQ